MNPAIAGSLIGIAGGVMSNAFNIGSQNKMNKRQELFTREMYNIQRGHALSDWNMQNAYNDPSAQMQRLNEAGLNPNLVYGKGADAQMGAPMRQTSHQQPNFKAPQLDAGSIALQAMQMRQMQSSIARTDAETKRINADTDAMLYQNKMLTPELFEQEYQHRKGKATFGVVNEESSSSIKKLEAETQALISGYKADYSPLNPNNEKIGKNLNVRKMQNDIERIMQTSKGQDLSNQLKQYETDLIKTLGVSGAHAGSAVQIIQNIFKLILLKQGYR